MASKQKKYRSLPTLGSREAGLRSMDTSDGVSSPRFVIQYREEGRTSRTTVFPRRKSEGMRLIEIAGLTRFTTIDYPGKFSAVLFCQGCPWRCGYCHNPHLQPFGKGEISWQSAMTFLKTRRGLLDAVVFSGGEPSLQPRIADAMQEVREMGFFIGLHTAGILPYALKKALPYCDWVGMDIKAPFDHYARITRKEHSGKKAKECALLIIESLADYEFRTTVHPNLLSPWDIDRLTQEISEMGAKHFVLQSFRREGCTDAALNESAFDIIWGKEFLERIQGRFESFLVR